MTRPLRLTVPLLLLLASVLAACASSTPQTSLPSQGTPRPPLSSPLTSEPRATLPDFEPQATRVLAATPIRYALPTPGLGPVSAWRPPPYPAPWALRPEDHFYLARPIPSGDVNWAHPLYRYGNTYFGEESVHTGVDLGAERDTPVLAAGPGEVIWAGYGLYAGVPDPNDPYGLAVAIRHDFGYEDYILYTVYGHLGEVIAWPGQRVGTGDIIGVVGDTGHASGPHLHFEVRLGTNRYFTTRNPELWMVPPEGWGVLVGRVLDTRGDLLHERSVLIRSLETRRFWEVWTYAGETVRSDNVMRENFAISDLPSGPYEVSVEYLNHTYTAQLLVRPGQTNFLVFRGERGFVVEPTPHPPDLSSPPTIR